VLDPLAEGAATVMAMGSDGARGRKERNRISKKGPATAAAVEQLSAGDLATGFKGFLDGVFVWLACGGEGEPLGGEGLLIALLCQKSGLQLPKGTRAL
jgi:hypothetical protein